jgi:hypothetical protein
MAITATQAKTTELSSKSLFSPESAYADFVCVAGILIATDEFSPKFQSQHLKIGQIYPSIKIRLCTSVNIIRLHGALIDDNSWCV